MLSTYARRVLAACTLSAAVVAAVAVPGAASAEELTLLQCEGAKETAAIHGKGSSAQKLVQINKWNLGFNSSTNKAACNGVEEAGKKTSEQPKVTYTSTGSGKGIESWGVETQKGKAEEEIRFGHENAYVGTEIAPNSKQEGEIKTHGGGAVLTIPVIQAAIAIVVHLPKGCTSVTGGPRPGRLAFTEKFVEKIFRGKYVTWEKVLNGATLVGNSECLPSEKITRVVREDGSGTTDSFMKFLGEVFVKPVTGTETWKQLGEKSNNTIWPNEGKHPVLRGNGGGGVVTKVFENAGTVGYANVADARNNGHFTESPGTGGPGTATFWTPVEGREPATNGESNTKGSSNCSATAYVNGANKFPPPSARELWNEVIANKKQPSTYALCYLSYDLALTTYEPFTIGTVKEGSPFSEPPTEGEAADVRDYLKYALSSGTGGGQPEAENEDYFGDPSAVLSIARTGAGEVGFR